MENDPTQIERIQQYLRRMTPQARRNLLVEIERMQIYGEDMPCSDIILAELRTEFRNSGESQNRVGNPSRHFFKPIEILFVDRAAELANSGQISRGSLAAIWEWINKSLLPTMAEEYCGNMKTLLVMDKAREAHRIAAEFQCKVAKCLESTLASEELVERRDRRSEKDRLRPADRRRHRRFQQGAAGQHRQSRCPDTCRRARAARRL